MLEKVRGFYLLCVALLARCRNASGRSCDRPSGHRMVFLVFPVFKQRLKWFPVHQAASAWFKRKPSRYGFIRFNPVTPKYKVVNLNSQIRHFRINEKLTLYQPLFPANILTCLTSSLCFHYHRTANCKTSGETCKNLAPPPHIKCLSLALHISLSLSDFKEINAVCLNTST